MAQESPAVNRSRFLTRADHPILDLASPLLLMRLCLQRSSPNWLIAGGEEEFLAESYVDRVEHWVKGNNTSSCSGKQRAWHLMPWNSLHIVRKCFELAGVSPFR